MDLAGRRVVVVGLGASGVAAARLCQRLGAEVVGTDSKSSGPMVRDLEDLNIELCLGGHQGVDWERADLIVVSPGVPPLEALRRAEGKGVEVISELELGWRFVSAPVICVGGTNGKSTVTTLASRMLACADLSVFSGGNLGTPLCSVVDMHFDVLVIEASSFQLERVPTFRPKVSVLLNISDDHLDRYESPGHYAVAKGNAFANQSPEELAVVPQGDRACLRQAQRGKARLVTFGADGDYGIEGRVVVERSTGARFDTEGSALVGGHNVLNAAAAIAAVRPFGVTGEAASRALGDFVPLGHRMAFVAEHRGVTFYDDSKATNVGAAVTALMGLRESRGVLIAGGRDKLGSYQTLVDALVAKGRAAVLIGEAAPTIARALGARLPVYPVATLEDAVNVAFGAALAGDAVLLSPACASFDMFNSYAERGDKYVAAVHALIAGRGQNVGEVRQ